MTPKRKRIALGVLALVGLAYGLRQRNSGDRELQKRFPSETTALWENGAKFLAQWPAADQETIRAGVAGFLDKEQQAFHRLAAQRKLSEQSLAYQEYRTGAGMVSFVFTEKTKRLDHSVAVKTHTFTFDLKTGKPVHLKDLFDPEFAYGEENYQNRLTVYSQGELQKKLGKNFTPAVKSQSAAYVLSHWALAFDGVHLYYDSPLPGGSQEVVAPYSEVADLMKADLAALFDPGYSEDVNACGDG